MTAIPIRSSPERIRKNREEGSIGMGPGGLLGGTGGSRATAARRGGLRAKFKFVFGELVRHGQNATPWIKNCLEQPEDRLNCDPCRNGAACRITCRHEFPAANGLCRALIEPQPNLLHDTNLQGAPVGAN